MKKNKSLKKEIISTIIELCIVALVTSLIFVKVVNPVKINGKSMYPTLDNNDMALIYVGSMKEEKLNRFDVVVLKSDQLDEKIVKRLIGFPGETVKVEDDKLYINGVFYEEPYLNNSTFLTYKETNNSNFTNDFEIVVPAGKYFVLGDNRPVSADSRSLGCFSYDEFIGYRGFVIYPFNKIKKI